MSFLGLSLLDWTAIAAIATAVLAVGAGFTVYYARNAFSEQSEELGELRKQGDDQRKVNEEQTTVLKLQAQELSASLDERKRQAEEQRRAQANQVAAWFGLGEVPGTRPRMDGPAVVPAWGAVIRNSSGLPIYDVQAGFHLITETSTGAPWMPMYRGGTPAAIPVLPPGPDHLVPIPEDISSKLPEVSDTVYVVSIEFTDSAGNRWERDARGALNPCD
jgi:hypothetical protein